MGITNAFQERVPFMERRDFKLKAAKYFVNKLKRMEKEAGSLASADRFLLEISLDAFLYELVGVFDALLQEINIIFQSPLDERSVSISKLIGKLPKSSQTRKKLAQIHGDTEGWFWQLREYRHHSAHRSMINLNFNYVNENTPPVIYLHKNPLDITQGANDEPIIQYCENSITRMNSLIQEISGLVDTDLRQLSGN
jgi:hypothetical protein